MASRMLLSNRGLGLMEILISVALVLGLGLVASSFITAQRSQSNSLSRSSTCMDIANTLVQSVKTHDNALVIRNYLPSGSMSLAPSDVNDPFCVSSTSPGCDTIPHVQNGVPILNFNQLGNFQNARGAASWAVSVYNRNNPQICNPGLVFDRAAFTTLTNFLPTPITIPPQAIQVRVAVNSTALNCNTDFTAPVARGANLKVEFWVQVEAEGGAPQECLAREIVSPSNDSAAPTIGAITVFGQLGVNPISQVGPIPELNPPAALNQSAYCSCDKPFDPANPCTDPETFEVRVEIPTSEPGTVLLCRRIEPFDERDVAFRNCGEIAGVTVTSATYNSPLTGRLTFNEIDDRYHEVEVVAVDTGGNASAPVRARYRPRRPVCSTVPTCAGPPVQDGCGGFCPVYVASPICPTADTVLCNVPVLDQCLNPCGYLGTNGCPPPPTAPPTAPPTSGPTAPPTAPPTSGPTAPPTSGPTPPPTAPPTAPPTSPPTAGPTPFCYPGGATVGMTHGLCAGGSNSTGSPRCATTFTGYEASQCCSGSMQTIVASMAACPSSGMNPSPMWICRCD